MFILVLFFAPKKRTVGVWGYPHKKDLQLFRLQIPIFFSYVNDARTILVGIQVVMPDYHGAGVAPVQLFE